MMRDKIKVGLVGFGNRGKSLLANVILPMVEKDVEIKGVCDLYEDRARYAAEYVKNNTGCEPFCTTDYHDITSMDCLDAVIIMSAWESHVPVAVSAMESGKYVGFEVGGVYSVEDCWRLVHVSENTGMPCMLLENCCYGRREMMVLNMVKQGIFGEVMGCQGGYCHDLRREISGGFENRHYRLRNYLGRNCENYPTHELGPLAKVLNINNGNRMLSLTSAASNSKGLNEYINASKGKDSPLAGAVFAQGDIVTTTIKCAKGQTITLTLDTTLPRAYSRGFTVHGTKAMYAEDTDSIFLDGVHNEFEFKWREQWGNASQYEKQYDHPLWKEFKKQVRGGHDGMDWLVFRAFIESVKAGQQTPIDVYDAAAWMCISVLSEESIACGSAPVAIPDFTNGRWLERHDMVKGKYCLSEICEEHTLSLY